MHCSTKRAAARCIGLLAYASFGFSLVWLLGFLTNFAALPVTVDRGPASAGWLAVPVDLLLIAVFGIQHSVMARRSFKKRWTRFVPTALERSVYVLVSSAVLLSLCLAWQPLPALIWEAGSVTVTMLAWTALGIGLAVLLAASFQIDHWELLGLRQTWHAAPGTATPAAEFTVRGFYRFVRHPIYVGWLLLFWITPHMSAGHLLLATGMTIYTLIAIRFEEHDLISEHGRKYLDYRDRVPALVPVPKLMRRAASARRKAPTLLPVLACAALALAAARSWAAEPVERLTLTVDGRDRTVVLAPPRSAGPRRLVLMLHGAGGNAERIRHFTALGLERQAAAANWIVAYPEGVGGTWNDCRKALPYPARMQDVDDVGFLTTLIETLRSRFGIAAHDVMVAGFSNGGQMAIRLALEQPAALGSIAVVAAQLPAPGDSICAASIPVVRSIWVNGSEDPFIPLDGGLSVGPDQASLGQVLSLAETIRAFVPAEATRMPARRVPERDGDPSTHVVRRDWSTAEGLYLRQYVLHGSGHVVPQREVTLPALVGHPAGDVDLGEILAGFVTTGVPPVGSRPSLTDAGE